MEGRRISAYRLERQIGAGGMSTVYLATVESAETGLVPGERVAVKVVEPELLRRRGFFKRFLREGEVGRRLDHENVVRALDVDAVILDGETIHFLVMEYVEGRTLRSLLADLGTVPEALLRELARQIASGLVAIHALGIVHRDMKPENVLVTEDHVVRIMDLGMARLVESSIALTREGQFAGSIHYAAPEQFRASEVGPAADLYSVGVLVYELATGENPFRGEDLASTMHAHLALVPDRAHQRNPDVSPFLSEVAARLLEKEPGDRFASAEELLKVLTAGEDSAWWGDREGELLAVAARVPEVPVRRETRLFGRERELALLRERFDRARGGDGNSLLIEGEAGIGKSRVVDAFLHDLETEDAHLLYGSFPPRGGTGGLADAIAGKFGTARLDEALRPYLGATPALVGSFAATLLNESPPPGAPALEAEALHAVFCHLLRALAAEKPLLWIVEDLHFAEPVSRRIFLSLARAAEGHRAFVLGTTRPGLPEDEQGHLARLPTFRRVPLGRLGARQVIELLRDAFRSEALAERLGGRIAYHSDGVPFFVFEMIRGLMEGQFLTQLPDGSWVESRVIEEIEVPRAVRDLIETRLGDLEEEERAILDTAAVLGYEFEPDLVARACELKRVHVLRRLAAVERRSGVVRAAGRRYRFDHHQIQEVLYEGLPRPLREETHTLLAECFGEREGAGPGTEGEAARFLASHHLRGVRPEAARPFVRAALAHLAETFRNEAAIDLADRALRRSGLLEGAKRFDVLIGKAGRLALLGRRPEERAALDEAIELAEALADPIRLARARRLLGTMLLMTGRPADALEPLGTAVELAREAGDAVEEGRAERSLGSACYFLRRYDEAGEHYGRALSIAREGGDLDAEAAAVINRGNVDMDLGRYEEAREHFVRGRELARECGNRRWEANATASLGGALAGLKRKEEAEELHRETLSMFREIGDRNGEVINTSHLALAAFERGRCEEALGWYQRSAELAFEIGNPAGEATARVNLAGLLLRLGDARAAEEALLYGRETAAEIGHRPLEGHALLGLAETASRLGDPKTAEERLREALAMFEELADPLGRAQALAALGLFLADEGREAEAEPVLEAARELCGQLDARDPGALVAAVLAPRSQECETRLRALLAREDAALSVATRMEARYRLFRATGEPAHLDRAHELLEELIRHAPEGRRQAMREDVPLHRRIGEAMRKLRG